MRQDHVYPIHQRGTGCADRSLRPDGQAKEVFVTRAQTDSLIATAQRLHISPETVKRESRRVQDKINRVRARQRRQTECFVEADKTF